MATPHDPKQSSYRARDVRQGEIILRTWPRRALFVAGLAAFVLLALVTKLMALW